MPAWLGLEAASPRLKGSVPEREALLGRWVHSHEEDTADRRVFRRAGFSFPPSRGREELELRLDGTAVQGGPGPTDVPEERPGTWELESETLRLAAEGQSRAMEIVAVEPEK